MSKTPSTGSFHCYRAAVSTLSPCQMIVRGASEIQVFYCQAATFSSERFPNDFMVSVSSFKSPSGQQDVHFVDDGPI